MSKIIVNASNFRDSLSRVLKQIASRNFTCLRKSQAGVRIIKLIDKHRSIE